jgi:uncharacterized protein (TIGR02266 family)
MVRNAHDSSRRFRRRTVRILVDYHAADGVRCEYATTLGAGGLFIETESPTPPDTQLKLRFRLADALTLHEIEGRVVWVRPGLAEGGKQAPGMGIQFTDSVGCSALARELEELEL